MDQKGSDTGKRVYISASAARKETRNGCECIFESQGQSPQKGDRIWVDLKWTKDPTEVLMWHFPDFESITESPKPSDLFRMIESYVYEGRVVTTPKEKEMTFADLLKWYPKEREVPFVGRMEHRILFKRYIPERGWVDCEDPRPA